MTTLSTSKHQSRVSWRLLAAGLLVSIFAAGCGGGGDDASSDATVLDADSVAASATQAVTSASATTTSASTGRAKASAASWVYCTYEGGTCKFSGTRQIRYAASNGAAVIKTFTNSVSCTNGMFGDPARNVSKACYYDSSTTSAGGSTGGTTTPTVTNGNFSKTQVFAMRNQYVSGMQGQYTTFDLRFYGVRMSTDSKVLVHLYDGNGSMRAATGHHLRYLPTSSWGGYVQYAHPVYVPTWLPAGTYRAVVGLYAYRSPWTVLLGQLAGNGVSQMGQGFVVGSLTVQQANRGAVADETVGPFVPVATSGWY